MARYLDELLDYARVGSKYAQRSLLSDHYSMEKIAGDTAFIKLNVDVRYYLRKSLGADYLSRFKHDVKESPGENLSPGRRAFIDKTVQRGDLKLVLETTEPCTEKT